MMTYSNKSKKRSLKIKYRLKINIIRIVIICSRKTTCQGLLNKKIEALNLVRKKRQLIGGNPKIMHKFRN